MRKEYGLIFLTLGIAFFGLFILYSYTDLFKKESVSNGGESIDNEIKTDYIKSYDLEKKYKISFPIIDNMVMDYANSSDYYKYYINSDGSSIKARILDNYSDLKKYINDQYDNYVDVQTVNNKTISYNDIKCNYTCRQYKIYKSDETLDSDEIRIYHILPSNELFEIKYFLAKQEISSETINTIINNINITSDATYTNGKIVNDKTVFELLINNKKSMNITLDSKTYKEEIGIFNSFQRVKLINQNNNAIIYVSINYMDSSKTIESYLNGYNEKNKISVEDIKIGNNSFKKYDYGTNICYVYVIDDNIFLLIDVDNKSVDINDFSNITIKDV